MYQEGHTRTHWWTSYGFEGTLWLHLQVFLAALPGPLTPCTQIEISIICLPLGLWNGSLWEELYKLKINIETLIVIAIIFQIIK